MQAIRKESWFGIWKRKGERTVESREKTIGEDVRSTENKGRTEKREGGQHV